jgi:hypothetical protein
VELPTTRPTLLAIVDDRDERFVTQLRDELPEWRVVACFVEDAFRVSRAFRFETVVVVGDARITSDVWSELEPKHVAFAPTLALVRSAVERLRRQPSGSAPPPTRRVPGERARRG